jgi:hypothetical protein
VNTHVIELKQKIKKIQSVGATNMSTNLMEKRQITSPISSSVRSIRTESPQSSKIEKSLASNKE